jgi:tyrosyl-tRNA synthetase
MEAQVILTGPLLEGLHAKLEGGRIVGEKMSKSLDNYVGVAEPPESIFGKLMSISDDLMWRYLELLSAMSLSEVAQAKAQVAKGTLHPKDVKVRFAKEMVERFHGQEAAEAAAADFDSRFSKKQLDVESLPEVPLALPAGAAALPLVRALVDAGLAPSTSDARRLIAQGAVRLDGARVTDVKLELKPGTSLVQVGKLRAARLKLSGG